VLEGSLELEIQGAGTKTHSAGEGFQVPAQTPHGGKTGDKGMTLVVVYVVEKGKPLATPV
jgi:quercetin dioxygenase-like cupin family protein